MKNNNIKITPNIGAYQEISKLVESFFRVFQRNVFNTWLVGFDITVGVHVSSFVSKLVVLLSFSHRFSIWLMISMYLLK